MYPIAIVHTDVAMLRSKSNLLHVFRPKKLSIVPFAVFLFLADTLDLLVVADGDLIEETERFADDGLLCNISPGSGSGLATAWFT